MSERKRLLVTGAAGIVGTAIRKHLKDRYDFKLLCNRTIPEDVSPSDVVVSGDIADFEVMTEAAQGVDGIVHLGLANRRTAGTRAELARGTIDVDIRSCYNIYEAARINGVEVVVFASTNHVTGLNEQDGIVSRPDLPVRPDGIYGAGKAFGEALGRYYADRMGVRVLCLRIANFNGKDEPGRFYPKGGSRWLSPRDCAQLVWRSIETTDVKFGVFYGVSLGGEEKWDLTNAREQLGYDPVDNGADDKWQAQYREDKP